MKNVKDDFSAAGDGITDDTTVIINALAADKNIYFPAGTYKVSSGIVLDGHTIFGDGMKETIIQSSAENFNVLTLKNNCSISDLRVKGISTVGGAGQYGITADAANPPKLLLLENIEVSHLKQAAIKLDYIENFSFKNIYTHDMPGNDGTGWGYHIILGACKNGLISGFRALGDGTNGRHALYISAGCRDININGVLAYGFPKAAITHDARGSQNYNERIHYTNCAIINSGDSSSGAMAIFCRSRDISLEGVSIYPAAGAGIHIEGTAADGSPANVLMRCHIGGGYSVRKWLDGSATASLVNIDDKNIYSSNTASDIYSSGESFGGGGGGSSFSAVTFDGSNDYLTRGADLTGNADGKKFTLSAWIKMNGGNGIAQAILRNATGRFAFNRGSSGTFSFAGFNASGTQILGMDTSSTYTASSTWHHIFASCDLSTGTALVYIDGVSNLNLGTKITTNDFLDYTDTNWSIGALTNGTYKANADIAEFWFDNTVALGASDVSKFFSGGHPVSLESDGSLPAGKKPLIYLKGPAISFNTNLGSGGNFTVAGTLTDAATGP